MDDRKTARRETEREEDGSKRSNNGSWIYSPRMSVLDAAFVRRLVDSKFNFLLRASTSFVISLFVIHVTERLQSC